MDEDDVEEKVRLLLLDNPRSTSRLSKKYCSPGPSYAWAIWWSVFPSLFIAVLVLVVFFFTVNRKNFGEEVVYMVPALTKSRFGRLEETSRDADMMSSEALLDSMFKLDDNVFIITDRALNWRSSCSLESILKISWHKNVFLMTFNDDYNDGIFEKALRSEYSHLMTLKVDGYEFFKNTLFDIEEETGRRKLRDAKLLTVWQFGGATVSEDVVAVELPKPDGNYCLVSPDMISCPKQCSEFLYQMMLSSRKMPNVTLKSLVTMTISKYCSGNGRCRGIRKLDPTCEIGEMKSNCALFRLPDVKTPTNETWNLVGHYCPISYVTSTS